MSRPARALLDTAALRHNLEQVRRRAPRARVMAVVKANAYGHGAPWVARTLSTADAFGVSSMEEGVQLREAGIAQPISLFEGFFSADELPMLIKHRLAPVIHHASQLQNLAQITSDHKLSVWLKIDTGMHRLGFAPTDAAAALQQLRASPAVAEVRLMSHFARADFPQDTATVAQIKLFHEQITGSGLESSMANSAGVLAWPASHLDWVRPGIMLYGASPMIGQSATQLDLKPVMTLQTALIAIHARRKGDPIGYGGDWHCPEDMPVGVAAIGYGDGYSRHAPAGTPVLVNNKRVPLVGRVSMDMITVDLRTQPRAQVGDPVVLWGQGLPVEEVAEKAGTVGYELLCHVTERVPRVVV
ncbi:MAG: alanine racemase [Gammaproteobacteria bacterium]|nr:alanine racemase [Gammaproteobacteria bacterium]